LSKIFKYHPSGNLKLNNLGIFQSLKLRNLIRKILRISLKVNFTANNLGCYGLRQQGLNAFVSALVLEEARRLLQETARLLQEAAMLLQCR